MEQTIINSVLPYRWLNSAVSALILSRPITAHWTSVSSLLSLLLSSVAMLELSERDDAAAEQSADWLEELFCAESGTIYQVRALELEG